MYKTVDGGAHWTRVGLIGTSQISRIVVDPQDGNHVLVAALGDPFKASQDRGVYETLDGGKSWKRSLFIGTSTGASDLAVDLADPKIVYAGMWQVVRTNWGIWSGGAHDGLYRSADGGATWTELTGHGLPGGELGRIGLALSRDGQHVYAIIQSSHGLLWRSDDAGANWRFVSANSIIDERPFYFSRLAIDPANANHAFALSVDIAETRDGGATWHAVGRNLGSDHHAMWISQDGRRIIQGGDKGVAFSFDSGALWERVDVLPISQAYHVGYDRASPYTLCAALQDDGTWCARGNDEWQKISGGDGTWVWPDPIDRNLIWYSSGGGNNGGDLWLFDLRTHTDSAISPYLRDQNVVPPAQLRYRFNWESPLAFDPFDPHIAYYGGNVVFRSTDRGANWRVMSPDLTRNIKAHQQITGGITNEGTGAETSDTILALSPSRVRRSEIWAGTDDGVVQLTLDGGARWKAVTIPGLDDRARVESIDPSPFSAAVAYASVDRHYAGDRTPYVYVTNDYGAHWRSIAANLPRDQFVRVIRQDPKNSRLLYAGLEQSFWVSWNGGGHWTQISAGLPAASVRDVRVQPDTDDLLVATHGRGVYVLDDASPLQHLSGFAEPSLLRPRTAYLSADDAVPITAYFPARPLRTPTLTIVDRMGNAVRHLQFDQKAGLQRVWWHLCDDPPVPWTSAPEWNRTEDCGPFAEPGTYELVAHVGGRTLRQYVIVRAPPENSSNSAGIAARHALAVRLFAIYSGIDAELNALDAMRAHAPAAGALRSRIDALETALSIDPQNSQDDDFLEDMLRERVQALIGTLEGSYARPTAAQYAQANAIASEYERLRARFEKVRGAIAGL